MANAPEFKPPYFKKKKKNIEGIEERAIVAMEIRLLLFGYICPPAHGHSPRIMISERKKIVYSLPSVRLKTVCIFS